jgi:hypothetical protein
VSCTRYSSTPSASALVAVEDVRAERARMSSDCGELAIDRLAERLGEETMPRFRRCSAVRWEGWFHRIGRRPGPARSPRPACRSAAKVRYGLHAGSGGDPAHGLLRPGGRADPIRAERFRCDRAT